MTSIIEAIFGAKPLALMLSLACWMLSRQGTKHPGWIFSFHLAVGVVIESWARYLALSGMHNLWLYNWAVPVEFTLQMTFAWACVQHSKLRLVTILLTSIFLMLYVQESSTLADSTFFMDHSAITSASFLAITYSYLMFILAEDQERVILHRPEFYMFLSVLLYYSGMIPLVGLLSTLNDRDPVLSDSLLMINDVLFLASAALFCFACWFFWKRGSSLWRTKI